MLDMVVDAGDGNKVRIQLKCFSIYNEQGMVVAAADYLGPGLQRIAGLGDPDLEDIVLSNGLPSKPTREVTEDFPKIEASSSRVFKID